jgi:poly-gamma-glutamate synthesis protein (capsule biosynthesis protein)
VDIVHGHSSHHVKGIEVHKDKLICYGCGDFINDYEGIGGFEYYRGDLGLMYFATVEASGGRLASLRMTPTRIRRFRVNRASKAEGLWLKDLLNREGKGFGARADFGNDAVLTLRWD